MSRAIARIAVDAAPRESGHRVMDRRAFVGGLALGTLAVPCIARAQPGRKAYRIGILE